MDGSCRGRGRGRGSILKIVSETDRGSHSNIITTQDLLNFFSLDEPKKFILPSTATGGMGIVRPRYVDTEDRDRRERDKDYAREYQEEELRQMNQAYRYSNSNRPPSPLSQSQSQTLDSQSQFTQASQLDEIEELSSIGAAIAPLKDLYQEEFRTLYSNYSNCFKKGRLNNNLVISTYKDEIVRVVKSRNVVIIAGSTGCGKTTQVPQYILDQSYHKQMPCRIVVTQPRRIAAISVARRVADEMRVEIGTLVGYQIGMDNKTTKDTCITYMTTGVLLQKFIAKKNMNDYTHVIIDEIHERNQETDFLMLVVKKFQRLNSRNTKIILMSATIDTDIYSKYFARDSRGQLQNAFVLDVEGKANTVSEFYMDNLIKLGTVPELDISEPRVAPECYDIAEHLIRTFDRIESSETDKNSKSLRGTVLIFLPGYEHIEEMKKTLEKDDLNVALRWWILPLHSSITIEEQRRVFRAPQPGFRKIILSTNIAESSITVSDIKFVIDFCLAKCLNQDPTTNYVSLKLEWASKASCNQRKGRAGRVFSGRVYRLVRECLFTQFEPFTTPEIKRSPLELVILKAKRLDLGEPKAVLALSIEPPEILGIEKSVLTLKELGALALTANGNYSPYDGDMTFIGYVMSLLPLDTKISKFILLGHVFDCLEDSIIIAACLSVMNFFSKPFGQKLEAYKSKLAWAENSFSDCFAYWHAYNTWSNFVNTGYFRRPGGQSEKDWAKHQFVELSRLYEVKNLVEEIKKRLHPLGIRITYHPAEVPTDMSKKEKVFILSVSLCGAFYPNYFIQAQIDEKLVYRELSKKNPLHTVYLSSLPSNQGIFYEEQIRKLLQGCTTGMRMEFEGSKALVQFETPNLENTATVNPAVFMAIKLRQENIPMEIHLLPQSILSKKMDLVEQKRQEHFTKNRLMSNNRICLVQEIMQLKKTDLPSLSQFTLKLTITEILNCGNFYAHYKEPDYAMKLAYLENSINMDDPNSYLKPLIGPLQVNSLVLAPYPGKNKVIYYRGIVQAIDQAKNHAEIFFVDYGNKMNIPIRNLRELDAEIDDRLLNIPIMALRCRLACLKPIFSLESQPGDWTSKANLFFRDFVEEKELIGRVYSIVDRCVNLFLIRLEPDGQETDINKELIRQGFAEHCEEDYLSKENHELRQTFEMMTEAQQEMTAKQYNGLEADLFHISLDDTNLTDKQYFRKTRLRGPYSPLESSFFGISKVSNAKRVVIERDSVNSITLDPEPHNHQTRLLVASYVSLNSRGDVMNARNTTLLPPINGLPSLMILLFTPAMELRRNCQKTKYTGAICGLGYNPKTRRAYYPDHDCEIEFDVVIEQEDLVEINFLRTCINLVLGDSEKYTNHTTSNRYFGDIRKNAKKHIQKLLSKPRQTQERVAPREPYTWGIVPDSDFIVIKMMDKDDDHTGNTTNLLPMHKAVNLNREEISSYEKWQQLELFRKRASDSNRPELNKCILCNKTTTTPWEIKAHLQDNEHMSRENYLLQAVGQFSD